MKKLHVSFLHNLDNQEFRIFYSSLIEYMEKKNFVDPTFVTLLNRLEHHKEDVSNLKSSIERYKNSAEIGELSRLRTDYFISLRLEIKAKVLSCAPQKREAAERLYTWISHYKKKPYIQSISTQDIVVDNMLARINKDESLRSDIAFLDLDELIAAIDTTTQEIGANISQRAKEKAERQKKGRTIRDAAYGEIKTLTNYIVSQLGLLQGEVEESEYYEILLDLHPKLKETHKAFKIRSAKDKTRKKKTAAKQLTTKAQAEKDKLETSKPNKETKPIDALSNVSSEVLLTNTTIEAIPEIATKKQNTRMRTNKTRDKIRKLLAK